MRGPRRNAPATDRLLSKADPRPQPFEYYIVLDFEATCNENRNRGMKVRQEAD